MAKLIRRFSMVPIISAHDADEDTREDSAKENDSSVYIVRKTTPNTFSGHMIGRGGLAPLKFSRNSTKSSINRLKRAQDPMHPFQK